MSIGHIHVCAVRGRVDPETLWVGGQLHPAHDGAANRVNYGQPSFAIANEDLSGSRVHTDVVGVVAQIDDACRREVLAPEQTNGTVTRASHRDDVRRRGVTDPLRVFETAYSLNDTPSGYVDDIQGAIAKFGDEQPPTPEVHGHVVDTPTCVRQEDGRL